MSAICQSFVQNAWKKDLCSNCFKSRDEHVQTPKTKLPFLPVVPIKAVEGIIKNGTKTKSKRTVGFTKELSEVIGYGGEVWSDTEEDDTESLQDYSTDNDEIDGSDDDVELKNLTKVNTDYNANLLVETVENKKTYTNLMLGKPQLDSQGRKQTLLVTVTPFGQDSPSKKYSKNISHIPIAKNNKETLVETKTNVVLTSYSKNDEKTEVEEKSLLEEISETLENSKNPIQIVTRKKTQKDIILTVSKPENNKENIEKETNNEKAKENKISNKSNIPERKVGITRTPVIKNQEKPIIFQTSVAKIELLNNKNLKLNSSKENLSNKSIKSEFNKMIKSEQNNNAQNGIHEEKETKIVETIESKESVTELPTTTTTERIEKVVETEKFPSLNIPQSREQAGEPDGRADPDEPQEPPALPLTPPPLLENHSTFLHSIQTYDKPKVPAKPIPIVTTRKPAPNPQETQNQVLDNGRTTPEETPKLTKQDSNGSDIGKISNKRRAPKPPPALEETPPLYTRNSTGTIALESDKEIRERDASLQPEITPRQSLSISTDSLINPEEKKKDKRGRFSLKKFLRMGSKSDLPKIQPDVVKTEEVDSPTCNKPRLIIVHPLELNGAKVEVVAKPSENRLSKSDYAVPTVHPNQEIYTTRAAKPPPPPRNLDDWKPLPHPPKSLEILNKQRQLTSNEHPSKKVDSVYANIGEVRLPITPNKPQRTASMREREALQQKRKILDNYEPIGIIQRTKDTENVYDYINSARSSSPEYDSSPGKNSPTSKTRPLQNGLRSGSSVDVSGDYFKYQNIPRSLSLTYCGSETESEIYSPYSFYGSETEVAEDDNDWATPGGRTHKLRSRKGRSIVHKNLEDNYGAVIMANHEALAQVLENIQHTIPIQPALRGLKTSPSLRWSDFTLKVSIPPLVVGTRTFHQATWGNQHVTLMISAGSIPTTSPISLGSYSLTPITEFSDLLPKKCLPTCVSEADNKHFQASVAVLPWLQVNSIQTYSDILKTKTQNTEDTWKDATFALLQLVNALKMLQAQGIEELPLSLSSFVLCREMEKDGHNRLCVLQGLTEDMIRKQDVEKLGSLCVCASAALKQLMPTSKISPLIQSLLNNERAVSLTQVKSVLEFSLWGPSDVSLSSSIRERELALQRWLDLQRATVLHGLVCTKVQLTVYEECHLLFLVRSSAKLMCDASLLLESSNKQNNVNKQK